MKINKIKTGILILASTLSFFSCKQLQSTLSSVQEAALEEATGVASVADTTWYYDGGATSDVSNEDLTFLVNFSKKVTVTDDLKASFDITYLDSDGNTTVVTKRLEGSSVGSLTEDCMSLKVKMSPVLAVLDGVKTKNGTPSFLLKVSGLQCNEGEQKGRSIPCFEKNINVEPLFSDSLLTNGCALSTIGNTNGKVITIPLRGFIYLSDTANYRFNSSTFDSNFDKSKFSLSVSDDGTKLLLTCNQDMSNADFTTSITIRGIMQKNSTDIYKISDLPVTFVPAGYSNDSLALATSSDVNYDINDVKVTGDSNNLYVVVSFNGVPGFWANEAKGRIVVLIDDTNISTGATSINDGTYTSFATFSTLNSTVEYIGTEIINDENNEGNLVSTTTSGDEIKWTMDSNYAFYAKDSAGTDVTSLKYTIPLSSISQSAAITDEFKIIVFASSYWYSESDSETEIIQAQDYLPSAAIISSTTQYSNDTIAVDFDSALSFKGE